MKRIAVFFLLLALCICLVLPAGADILWEPTDNSYYWNNYENCDGVALKYYVPEGLTVTFYKTPESSSVITIAEPGTRVYVGFSQTVGGELWGVGYTLDGSFTEGWFRLGRLQREYDNELFLENFGDQAPAQTVTFSTADLTDPIPTWTYPGSGISDGVLDFEWPVENYNDGKLECSRVYTDPAGGQWGYVGYYMGHCGWVYLDDLYTEAPPSFPHEAASTVTDRSPTESAPSPACTWLYLLVAAVVLFTAGLIVIVKRKKH